MRALHEHADLDARRIEVIVSGDVVTLTGTVESWMQRDAVEPAEPAELEPADEIC